MSNLHNLSAPIEQSPEDIAKVEETNRITSNAKIKNDLKNLFSTFKREYLNKLFLSLGIAVTVCIFLIWIISKLFSPDVTKPSESVKEISKEAPINQEDTVKFRKFDGHQYFFYVPEDYSFLNRTRNKDLNEIVFSDKNNKESFLLQEFETDNDNEETLDSIYSYTETTLQPIATKQIEIKGNTFKERIYNDCAKTNESSQAASEDCTKNKITYYSIYINGILVLFRDPSDTDGNDITTGILNTFTKNVIAGDVLSEDYIKAKIPLINNKLQALFAFGTPQKTDTNTANGTTSMTWPTTSKQLIVLTFDPRKNLVSANGISNNNITYNLLDKIDSQIAGNIYKGLTTQADLIDPVTGKFLKAKIRMDDHIPSDNLWEVNVSDINTGITIGDYQIDKTTYLIPEK